MAVKSSIFLSHQTVAVIGSGTQAHDALASAVGELLARLGVNLLTGGGHGVMTSVARAFVSAPRERGISIGIIPCASEDDRARPKPGYPNPFVELPIYTHLPKSGDEGTDDLSRNHINVLSAVAVVALPGEEGTASEIALAVHYRRPIILFSPESDQRNVSIAQTRTLAGVESFVVKHLGRGDHR